MSATAFAGLGRQLDALRENATRRWVALAGGFLIGLALAWVHWLGLILGGALVGLTRQSLLRAVLAGLGFGVTALVVMVLAPGLVGVGAVSAFAPVSYVTAAIGLVLPAWGALVRGVR